ncbi:MAG: hypothetical protein ACM3TR_06750 [Caulobacteraceae bacterium]
MAVKYNGQGMRIGFASNGLAYNGKKMPSLLPGMNLTPLLDQIAQITQRVGGKKMAPLEKMLHKGKLYTPFFIFCFQVDEGHYVWYQQNKNKL